MKWVFLALGLCGFAAAGFWYVTENEKAVRAEAYRREQARLAQEREREAQRRAEAEKLRKAQEVKAAKDDAVALFMRYLDREEQRLRTTVEELKIKREKVAVDRQSLSEELLAIERANAKRVESAKKRGEKQRDKVERVLAMLKSPTLNRLASTYLGEDLSALRAKFQAEVQRTKDVDDAYLGRMTENRRRFDAEVKDADDEVGQRLGDAKKKLAKATARTKANVAALEKRLADLSKKRDKLEEKERIALERRGGHLTPWEKRDLERLQSTCATVEAQLAAARNQLEYGDVDAAHGEAIVAETRARSRVDTAIVRLRDADAVVQAERDHEQDVHNTARHYEHASLDQLRTAMARAEDILAAAQSAAQEKLDYVLSASGNMDFLNAQEVEAMRRKVAKRLEEQIAGKDAAAAAEGGK